MTLGFKPFTVLLFRQGSCLSSSILGEKNIQDYKIIFYSPYRMSWQSVSVAGVPKLNTNHCIIDF